MAQCSWEVVWRETDRGTESSSGSPTGTSYTIDQLESTTIYTVTVRASNIASASACFLRCIDNVPSIIILVLTTNSEFQQYYLKCARQMPRVLSLTIQGPSLVQQWLWYYSYLQ